MKTLTLVVVGLGLLAAACDVNPQSVEQFKQLDPASQAAVISHIQNDHVEADRRALQLNPFLTCVRHHESDRSGAYPYTGGYSVWNLGGSGANGAYQFLNSTWRDASAKAGYPGYPSASSAPWYVQDYVAYHLAFVRGQKFHWNGTGC